MKKQLAVLVLMLICGVSAVAKAHRYDLRQFYDGAAKPRAEVVWIWLEYNVSITGLDGLPLTKPPRPQNPCLGNLHIAELLPGKHQILVHYYDPSFGVYAESSIPLSIDGKGGENYQVKANYKARIAGKSRWNPTIEAFTPDAKNVSKADECRF
jgi:hypothetical protein